MTTKEGILAEYRRRRAQDQARIESLEAVLKQLVKLYEETDDAAEATSTALCEGERCCTCHNCRSYRAAQYVLGIFP